MPEKRFQFVDYLWDDAAAEALDPVERLVYRSNILGRDGRITNTGGGNTSSKIIQRDPLIGDEVEVLWVKGSGGDLRTSKRENFSSLYLDKLLALPDIYLQESPRGPKTPAEDRMVGLYPHCTYNLNPRATSIDTPLHAYIPHPHVDHTHPNAVISVAAAKNAERLTREIYGDDVIHVPWVRPGFELGLMLQSVCKDHPRARGAILGQHGLINWADKDRDCYDLSLELIEKAAQYIADRDKGKSTFGGAIHQSLPPEQRRFCFAEILPWLRGQISAQRRFIGTIQDDDRVLRFVNSHDAARLAELGTSCPDHFLRTKIKPLFVAWDPQSEDIAALRTKLESGLAQYRTDYAGYYTAYRHPNSPAMRDPNPTVILIPGLGMIAWGKDKSEFRVTAEFYKCAIEVMRGAEAIDEYVSLPQQEAFDIEYWLLEEAKLARMPAEAEMAREAVVIIGAGSGIGREVAHRLVAEGAHIACADLRPEHAQETADQILAKTGMGIGVAGSGISGCGRAVGVGVDITDRESVRAALTDAVLAYGGIDAVVVTAGIFVPPDIDGRIPDEKWMLTYRANVIGAAIVAEEANRIWQEQGLSARMVITTSVNGVVSKKGSVAYDTSKAAADHLVRELAVEMAPLVRVNAVAPATVVQGSAMFPRDRVIASLAKYRIEYSADESDDALRTRLAGFYAQRTLLKCAVTAADQAEACWILVSNRLSKTTGQIVNVDGGLHEAFLR